MNTHKRGNFWEEACAAYLQAQGIRILERQFRTRQGEIDLIGLTATEIIFFEIKYRANTDYGLPEQAVDLKKRRRICRSAVVYMQYHPQYCRQPRFDVIAIEGEAIRWYPNAFPYIM